MLKITFMGAGSTVFARNVLGDVMSTEALRCCEIALYDIDPVRLDESNRILCTINRNINESRAVIKTYLGEAQRKEALRGAHFVVNAIQVGGYEPCTVIDFEIPKKYGLKQTIADTLTIEAARTRKMEDILHAVMLDPHTAAELSIDDMQKMVKELIEAHGPYMEMYK